MLCLLLIGRKKKKETGGIFFSSRAGHALLALLYGIFAAVKFN
jgi:hypothetical protein